MDIDDENKAPTVGEIAKNISNSQNTVPERITRLENKGFVKRVKNSYDRRISRVVLTEEGRNLINLICKEANSKFLFNSIITLSYSYYMECIQSLFR